MLVDQVFSAHLVLPDNSYQDITAGILNVDISHGTEVYEGPYQQIDTGLFTIVSRSSNLDPNINVNITEGAAIEFRDSRNVEEGKSNVFFLGYITDIDVQYQRDDDPIITITGTDVFGLLQRTVVSEDLKSAGTNYSSGISPGEPDYNGPSLNYLVNTEAWNQNTPVVVNIVDIAEIPGAIDPSLPYDNYLGYAPARYLPEIGETLLEILNKYTQTNLNYCSVNYRETPGIIDVYPYAKYNGFFWIPTQDPALEFSTYNFSSDPADGRPYESILLNNGYNRRTKALDISNETRNLEDIMDPSSPIESNTITYPPFKNNDNVTQVATSLNTNFATSFVENNAIDLYANDIFQVVNLGSDEIQEITFDNARKEDIDNDYTYSFSQLNQFIRIKHQVSESQIIDRFYDIAGIRHNITPDKWEMGFTFKPSQNEIAFNYQGQIPTIQMNALTGDSNFNFTATITDYPVEDIDQVFWCLNGTNNDVIEQWTATVGGERYKDLTPRTGLTQTWNFDDDGILEGPDFPTGGYGTGEWYVIPYIILKNGWVTAPNVMLTVGTPEVEARFNWSQNLTNNFGQVTFTDDSRNNEIDEVDSYLWDFGDGNTSTLKNPVHTYNPGPSDTEYEVSLTVYTFGTGGIKVYNTHTETITLTQPTMVADFTWVANAQVITFTNTSTNVGFEEPDAYLWNFGDGTTSIEKNPVHTFPVTDVNVPQSYTVTLTIRNIWEQTASVTKTITTVALNESGTFPVRYIKFSIDPYQKAGTVPSGGDYEVITPVMSVLKAITSGTGANLAFLKPTVGFNDNSIPRLFWLSTAGSNVQQTLGWEYFLTRDIQTNANAYGLGAASRNSFPGVPYNRVRWELVVDLGTNTQLIKDIILRFEDLIDASFPGQIFTESFYPKINIEFANTVTTYTPNPAGTYGPATLNGNWVNVGYIKLDGGRMDPTKPAGQRTNTTKTIFKMRPLPLNIPYFNYTFNDKIVSFTSVETADSYAWDFGDGTTSTLKDPVKTYAAYGTYNVSLAVTNGGVVTRTTTEPVIVQAPVI